MLGQLFTVDASFKEVLNLSNKARIYLRPKGVVRGSQGVFSLSARVAESKPDVIQLKCPFNASPGSLSLLGGNAGSEVALAPGLFIITPKL